MGSILFSVITIGLLSLNLSQNPSQQTSVAKSYPVGQVSVQEIVSFNPEYRERADGYTPNSEALEFFRHFSHPVTIEVFYGGWCGDSRAHVPSYIKLLEMANNPNITTTFVAVDEKKQEPIELTQGRHIERVPTFIVYAEGQEVGRIVETPEGSVEEHLVKILKSISRGNQPSSSCWQDGDGGITGQ
ncbi:MAG: thioredoxin family protein [Acidobacteria bacterium]|nr:thioredoxin family protein [Acidobacteriota bacterium]